MRHRPAQILAEARADLLGKGAGPLQPLIELLGAVGQPERLQLGRPARRVLAEAARNRGCS